MFKIPKGLHIFTDRSDETFRCDDCSQWADEHQSIRHSRRCDTPDLQVTWVVEDTQTYTEIAGVEVPTISEGGAIDWSKIKRHSREWEAAQFEFGHGSGNFDLI